VKRITPYVTDLNNNLQAKALINDNATYSLTARSVTTLVVDLEKIPSFLEQAKVDSGINIYPNPTNGLFQIKTSMPVLGNSQLTITDLTGSVLYTKQINCSNYQTIDISDKAAGYYILHTHNRTQIIIKK